MIRPIDLKPPVPFAVTAIKKQYRVLAKYSLDTGNNLEDIGPEACTHLVSFWEYLSPLFRKVFIDATEQQLRLSEDFCRLSEGQQRDVINKKWNDYVSKHNILGSAHAWALDKDEEA